MNREANKYGTEREFAAGPGSFWVRWILAAVMAALMFIPSQAKMTVQEFEQMKLDAERQAAGILERAMEDASEITLFSIAPDSRYEKRGPEIPVIAMPAWPEGAWTITGTAVLKDREEIAALASSLHENILQSKGYAASCFRPRHALRFKRGTEIVTLLVCFECLQCDLSGFKEREKIPWLHLSWSGNARATWNRIYRSAGLTLQIDPVASGQTEGHKQ